MLYTTRISGLMIAGLLLAATAAAQLRVSGTAFFASPYADFYDGTTWEYMTSGVGSSFIYTDTPYGTGSRSFQLRTNDGLFQLGPFSGDQAVAIGTKYTTYSATGNYTYSYANTSDQYVIKATGSGTSYSVVVFRLQGSVRTLDAHTAPTSGSPNGNTSINVTTSGTTTGQGFYLRYTTNNWTSSTLVEMSGSGTAYAATIPAAVNQAGTTVKYYFFSSGSGLTPSAADADLYAINTLGSTSSPYTYTVASGWTSAADGNWNSASTWTANAVPSTTLSLGAVTLNHNVSINQDASVSSISVAASKTLTSSGSYTLTIASAGSLSGPGSVNLSSGTVVFSGTGTVLNGSTLQHVTISSGVAFGASTTINGTLRLNPGGYAAQTAGGTGLTSAASVPNWGSASTLDVNTSLTTSGSEFYKNAWGTSTEKSPKHVTLRTGGALYMGAGYPRSLSGVLTLEGYAELTGAVTIKSGGEFYPAADYSGSYSGITMERELAAYKGFRLLGSPSTVTYADLLTGIWTQGATGGNAPNTTTSGTPNVFTFSHAANTWSGVTSLSGSLSGSGGILLYHFNDDNYDGTPNASASLISQSFSAKANNPSPVLNTSVADGYSLNGNPYPASLNIGSCINFYGSGIRNQAWVWQPSAPVEPALSAGSWVNAGVGGSNTKVAPFQGFLLQRNGSSTPVLTLDYNLRGANGVGYLKEPAPVQETTLRVSGNGMTDWIQVLVHEQATAGDDALDAWKLAPLASAFVNLALEGEEKPHFIRSLPADMRTPLTLPVSLRATHSGVYEIRVESRTIPEDWILELYDLGSGRILPVSAGNHTTVNISANAKIRPDAEIITGPLVASSAAPRFELRIQPPRAVSYREERPAALDLRQNVPNPFNPVTTVTFTLHQAATVRLAVADASGRLVRTLVSGYRTAGIHTVTFDGTGLASGVYSYRLEAGNQVVVRRMTLIK